VKLSKGRLFSLTIRLGLLFGLLFLHLQNGSEARDRRLVFRKSRRFDSAAIKWDGDNPQYTMRGNTHTLYGTPKGLDASVAFYENATRLSRTMLTFGATLGRPTIGQGNQRRIERVRARDPSVPKFGLRSIGDSPIWR